MGSNWLIFADILGSVTYCWGRLRLATHAYSRHPPSARRTPHTVCTKRRMVSPHRRHDQQKHLHVHEDLARHGGRQVDDPNVRGLIDKHEDTAEPSHPNATTVSTP
jgi:hypothetical protein